MLSSIVDRSIKTFDLKCNYIMYVGSNLLLVCKKKEKRKIFYIHYDDNQPVVGIMHDLASPMRFLSYDYILHNVYKKCRIKL